jgi:hypothetical protein
VEPTEAPEREIALSMERARRARRRAMRRRFEFWLTLLVIIVIGAGATAVLFGWRATDSSSTRSGTVSATGGSAEATSTTSGLPPIPPAKPYKVTDGVNIRAGPGTTYPIVGTVETGFEVLVVCAIAGQFIDGPGGPTDLWVRVVYNDKTGYITGAYVATGPAINDPSVIARCPSR